MTTQQLHTSAVAAARRSQDLLGRSLAVINQVRPGYYAVILGPTARSFISGEQSSGSIVVTNDDALVGDYIRYCGETFDSSYLTPQHPGVNVVWCDLSLQDVRKAIVNQEDRLYIKPDGLWVT